MRKSFQKLCTILGSLVVIDDIVGNFRTRAVYAEPQVARCADVLSSYVICILLLQGW